MEEKKELQQNTQGGQGGGRHRRRRHKGGNGGQNLNVNGQNAQGGQAAQNQPAVKAQTAQNQPRKEKDKNRQNGEEKKQNKQPQPQQNQQQNKQNKQKQGNKEKARDKNEHNKNEKKEENRKDTYLYTLDGNLYVNLTNKCSNGCDFCVRNERTSYYGNYLWLRNGEPTAEKVIAAAKGFGDLSRFKEVVFCGFGEPTYRVAEMLALCDYFHEKGLKTRLNTNGQGNLINKRDITPELKGKIDFVNISLNASCYEKYQPICRSQFKEAGFAGLIEFAKLCRRNGVACRFSIVDCIGEAEVEACKLLAESVKIPLYVRKYITDS